MKIVFATLWLLSGMAWAQEGFSPTLPWGTRTQNVQAGDIHSGFSPTMPYVKVSEQQQSHHDSPHQDPRYCPNNGYRPYGYYNNYYYGPGSGYYYNNGYNGYGQSGAPVTPSQGVPGYDTPLPNHSPPGY